MVSVGFWINDGKKVLVCLKGPPLNPSNTLWFFFRKMFLICFLTLLKHAFDTNSRCFPKNMQVIKRKKLLTARSSNCSVSAKFCPILVETPYSGGVINTKTYLNHELGSEFFFLSSLAYKLVNLLVFEFFNVKWARIESIKIIGLGLKFT